MEDQEDDGQKRDPGADQWRAIFEHSLDAVLILDDERRLTDVNPAACELLGAPRAQLIGAFVSDYLVPAPRADLPDTTQRWLTFLRDGRDYKECACICAPRETSPNSGSRRRPSAPPSSSTAR